MGSIFGQVEALGYSFLKTEDSENSKEEADEDVDMDGNQDKRKGKEGKENTPEPKGKGKAEEGDNGKRKEDNPLLVADSYLLSEVEKLDLGGVDEIYRLLRDHPQLESALMNAFMTIAQNIRYESRSFATGVELRCLVSILFVYDLFFVFHCFVMFFYFIAFLLIFSFFFFFF